MLTKEECLEALEQSRFLEVIICNGNDFVEFYGDFDKTIIYKCFEQLINEHFNNSLNFKHFKLHSNSTLKSFNKDELIEYIHMVYHNWQCADSSCENAVKMNYKLQKEIDELDRALDKACELLKEAVCQDCTIFDEVIEENYMFITEKEEWKKWLMKDE